MNNIELLDEIQKWNTRFTSSNDSDSTLYELAFFKIFIKFEKFLSDCFENYCIGQTSENGYAPNRRLEFDDVDHLNKVIQKGHQTFINHFDVIRKLSDCFFTENPFDIIKTDPKYSNLVNEMKIIRDYIAHESSASKAKYTSSILNARPFMEPYIYLKKINPSNSKSNYTKYIEAMIAISNYILNSNT